MRQLWDYWTLAVENLWRHKTQSFAVFFPLVLALAASSAMTFVRDGFLKDAELSVSLLPDLTVQNMVGGRIERVSEKIGKELKKLPYIKTVLPRIWGYIPLQTDKRLVAYTLIGVDPANNIIADQIALSLEAGRFIRPDDDETLVVGKGFSEAFNVKPGDDIVLRDSRDREYNFKIVGIFSSAVQIYTADMLVAPIDTARRFLGYSPTEATDYNLYLDDILYATPVAERIQKIEGNLRVLTRDALARLTHQAYGGRAGVFQLMWLILLLSVVLIAWAQLTNVSLGIRREIGILKALGWGTTDIIWLKMFESLALGLMGFLLGTALGFVYLFIDAPGLKEYFLSWATIYPDFPIPLYVRPGSLFLLLAVSVCPLLAASVIPAWLLGITDPDKIIRE
jgi:ABC-type lipoprotein release transport system permease subunit